MTKNRGINRPHRHWTDSEVDLLKQRYPDEPASAIAAALDRTVPQIYGKAKKLGLAKSEDFKTSPASGRLQPGSRVGLSGQFMPGHAPANKGIKGWNAGGRSAETRFKKGHINTGAKAERPLGAERINSDGYLERKVRMDLRGALRWAPVHRLNWIEANGPIPPGHSLAFKDGNRLNVGLGNLELISDQEKMRRNSIHNLPPALKEVVTLRGAIVRKINRNQKEITA